MAQISNLNVQVNQNQVNANAPQISSEGRVVPPRLPLPDIRSGTLVEGQVLSRNQDGSYTVRINPQNGQPAATLSARATLDLIVGENFRAVWDASGPDRVPILRLSENELSFLSKLPQGDRELATALLSRSMPLSNEVLGSIREAWRRMGGKADQLSPLLELWGRELPMTSGNVQVLSWYSALSAPQANEIWARVRKELKERSRNGENPVDILKSMKEGDDDIAKFLQGHSLLLRAPRDEVNPALLNAPYWPMPDEESQMSARVFVGRSHEHGGKRYWQVGFGVDGSRLGFVGGDVESDGRAYNLNLYGEMLSTCELLKQRRHIIRKELESVPLSLQYIGISQILSDALRRRLLAGRGLDVTI